MKILHQVSKDRLPERYQKYCDPETPIYVFFLSEGEGGCLGVFGAISASVFCFLFGLLFLFISVVEAKEKDLSIIFCAIFLCLAYLFWRGFQNERRKAKITRQGKWRQGVYVDSDGILKVDAKNRCTLIPRSYVQDNFSVEYTQDIHRYYVTRINYYTPDGQRQSIVLHSNYVQAFRAWSKTGRFNP